MRTLGRIAGLWILASVFLSIPAPAAAQRDDEYEQVLEEAVGEYNAGRYAEARALFRRAHEIHPNARTLRGMGMAAFEMREYVEALHALEAALASDRRPLTAEQRDHVRGLIDRSNAYVGRYRVELEPETAELRVDDAPAELGDDGLLILDLGTHSVEARCAGCRTERRSVEVRGGEDEPLRFELQPSAATGGTGDGADASSAGAGAGTGTAPDADGGASPAGLILVVGAGVLAAGTAGGAFWWVDRADEIDRCDQAGDACRNGDTLSTERTTAAIVTVGLGVAAIGALVGGLILLSDDGEGGVAVRCAPGAMGVGCAGTF